MRRWIPGGWIEEKERPRPEYVFAFRDCSGRAFFVERREVPDKKVPDNAITTNPFRFDFPGLTLLD